MKARLEAVHVEADGQGVPLRLIWRGRPLRVMAVHDRWRYASKWWLDGKGWRRAYFLVTVRDASGETYILEVFQQRANWVLSRVGD
jgi:hypothetical protein